MKALRARLVRLLRWSEKYTKTDMVYLATGGFWLLAGHLLQIASGLLLAVAFANLLPKETYGTYQFVLAGAAILSAFTLTGMEPAITRAAARGDEGALRSGFKTQLRWSIGIVLASAALSAYYFLNENATLGLSFLIVGALAPFLEGFELTRPYLVGKQLFKETALLGLGRRLIPLVTLLATLVLTKDPVTLIAVYFFANTVSAGFLYLLVVRRYKLPTTSETELLGYSKHLSILRFSSDIASQADKVLVWMFLGAVPLAVYTLAFLPVSQVQGVFKLARSMIFPKLSIADFSELKKTLPHKASVFLFLTLCAAVLYILVAPYAFALFFPAYPESVLLSQALALSLLAIPRTMYWQALMAHEKTKSLYILNLTQNGVRILSLCICIPLYGLWGAVLGVLIAELYTNIATRILFRYAA